MMSNEEQVLSDAEREDWPVVFPVCTEHKAEFFEDYERAYVSEDEPCVLCHPQESDSLGG